MMVGVKLPVRNMDQDENKPEGWYVEWAGFWKDGKSSRSEGPMTLLQAQSYAACLYESDCSVPIIRAQYNSKDSPVYKEFLATDSFWVRNPRAIREQIAREQDYRRIIDRKIATLNEELELMER